MESLSERSESQRYENAKKWHKRRIRILFLLLGTVIIFAVAFSIWMYYTKDYNSYQVLNAVQRSDTSATNYTEYNNKLMKYSRDGAVGYNAELDMEWSGSYNFASPIVDMSDEYVALADAGGNEVYIFDGTGSPTEIEVLYPISLVRVASQGVVAIAMSSDNSDLIQIYDSSNNNELLVEFKTNVSEDGYPVDLALSLDGRKLVTAYLNVTGGTPTSKVTFYNLGEVGKNYSNNIVAAKTYEKEIISKVEFFENDTVCTFGEQGFHLHSMRQLVEDVESKTFKKTIKSVFLTEEYFGFVFEPQSDNGNFTVEMYDANGNVKMTESIDFAYNTVYMAGGEIIFMADQECHILRTNGTQKFHCVFESPISYIMPVSGFNKYVLVDDNSISSIKIMED